MSELDMEKELELEDLKAETTENAVEAGDDFGLDEFGLDEFASDVQEAAEDDLAEYASAEVKEDEEEVGMEKIASCFPDWSLTPEEMFKADESSGKKAKK